MIHASEPRLPKRLVYVLGRWPLPAAVTHQAVVANRVLVVFQPMAKAFVHLCEPNRRCYAVTARIIRELHETDLAKIEIGDASNAELIAVHPPRDVVALEVAGSAERARPRRCPSDAQPYPLVGAPAHHIAAATRSPRGGPGIRT
jgi:hypothetical protein